MARQEDDKLYIKKNEVQKYCEKYGVLTQKELDVDWDNIEWVDEKRWSKIKWDNKKYKGIHERIKSKESFFNVVEDLITDKDISKKDKKNVLSIVETRFTNILGASNVSAEKSKM